MATVAPAAAMSRAMARPIPVAPPVRSTTLSFREGMSPCLLVLLVNSACQLVPDLKNSAQKPYRWDGTGMTIAGLFNERSGGWSAGWTVPAAREHTGLDAAVSGPRDARPITASDPGQ